MFVAQGPLNAAVTLQGKLDVKSFFYRIDPWMEAYIFDTFLHRIQSNKNTYLFLITYKGNVHLMHCINDSHFTELTLHKFKREKLVL